VARKIRDTVRLRNQGKANAIKAQPKSATQANIPSKAQRRRQTDETSAAKAYSSRKVAKSQAPPRQSLLPGRQKPMIRWKSQP
jgi:hypothetical protein